MSTLTEALVAIQNRGLDKIRCALTGAPYATIEESEIMFSLQASIEDSDVAISAERLVDEWELKSLTFNAHVLPALRGVKAKSMLTMIRAGHGGQVKALTYLLTRLLFPHVGSEPMTSEKAKERMLFAIHMYDTFIKRDEDFVANQVQSLVVVDAYVAMPYWHTLWVFESAFSKLGLAKAPKRIQEVFADPLRIADDESLIPQLVKYMYDLMIYVTERDGAAGRSGNRVAQQIMLVAAAKLPKVVIPHFQKTLSEADRIRLEDRRKMDSKPELRMAWSATHGRSRLANGKAVTAQGVVLGDALSINKMASDMKAALAQKTQKAKAEKKAKPASVSDSFAAAFNKVMGGK